jgi:hypothetical protein
MITQGLREAGQRSAMDLQRSGKAPRLMIPNLTIQLDLHDLFQ